MSDVRVTGESAGSRSALAASLREGWRQAQGILTEMFQLPVTFGLPVIDDGGIARFAEEDGLSAAGMAFTGGSSGIALLFVSRSAVQPLVAALLGEAVTDPEDIVTFYPTTVLELGNVVLNCVVAEAGRTRDETYRFELPAILSHRELTEQFDSASTSLVLVGEATVDRGPPSRLGIGLLFHREHRNDHV
ncbi:MAG: hypothetical protein ACOCW3_05275 [Spirochaetota bacterium]